VVDVLGRVNDDIRVVGGDINVADGAGGDVAAMGGTVRLLSGSAVEGDVLVGSGNVTVDGTVNGTVRAWGGRIQISGTVRNGINATSTETIVIGRGAVIDGDVVYRSPKTIVVENGAQVRGKVVRESAPEAIQKGFWQNVKDFLAALSLIKLLALLGAGLLGVWIFGAGSRALLTRTVARPWRSLAVGFVALVVVPALVTVLMFTLVGIIVGLFILMLYFLFVLAAYVYAGILLGAWLFQVYSREKVLRADWTSVLAGIVLLYVIGFIPIIGWLIGFVLLLMTLGGMVEWAYLQARGVGMGAGPGPHERTMEGI
jgi:cytoskeletal protein CcmA (bactofilin family)